MTDLSTKYNKSNVLSNIDSLVDEVTKVNMHIKEHFDALKIKYNLTKDEEKILYTNIEKIVNIAINHVNAVNHTDIQQTDYKIIGFIWTAIQSEYLLDTKCEFEKNKIHSYKRNQNMLTNLITDNFARRYLNNLLISYGLKDPMFSKDELI